MNHIEDYTILQASQLLGLTTRTIYNYLKKGIIKGYKWNGIWLIENRSVLELNMKINRTKIELKSPQKKSKEPQKPYENSFWVDKEHYEDLLRQVGQLRAAENLLIEYKSQNQSLLERIKELEKEMDRLRAEDQRRGFWRRLKRKTREGETKAEKNPSEA